MTDATKTAKSRRCPLVVVAGQVPPPTGGQNVMIAQILAELGSDSRYRTEHLAFGFTPDLSKVRQPHFSKVLELAKVYWRIFKLLLRCGRADLLIYPSGGPENVPVVRDILLLPAVKVLGKNLWVQFHAAGIAERLRLHNGPLERFLRFAYRGVNGAIVMAEFNRHDPEALRIPRIKLLPHRLVDLNCKEELPDFSVRPLRILYAGHLCSEKGIPQLLEAFAGISARHSELRLVLMGECLPPYSSATFEESCRQLGISEKVELTGLLTGEKKTAQFRSAHFFVFPSIAPYESFGLTMVEAMMWGLPMVVSDWRGNREVAGPPAIFFEVGPSMSVALTQAMFRLMENPLRWETVARETRERFSSLYRQKTPQYPDLVSSLLAG
jgi:glycosyltransferase involved in cell wall biosynthesis